MYGASPEERAAWRLPDSAAGFAYLARSSCFELPGQSNAEEYQVGSRAWVLRRIAGLYPALAGRATSWYHHKQ